MCVEITDSVRSTCKKEGSSAVIFEITVLEPFLLLRNRFEAVGTMVYILWYAKSVE